MTIQQELDQLADDNGGVLRPQTVVEHARDETTALHNCFEWDDSVAAEEYRLEQARRIIRAQITHVGSEKKLIKTRVFHSLPSDRGRESYRRTVDILSDADRRAEMLRRALIELSQLRKRYSELSELVEVFAAVEAIEKAA